MEYIRRHKGHTEVKTDQYWALGYYFETLNHEQKHQRREYLEWYGFAAQWSVLVIFVLFQVAFFVEWVLKSGLKYEQPKSPSFTKRSAGTLGWLKKLQALSANLKWWIGKDVVRGWDWGTRGEWIGATVWTVWLLYLCIAKTGNDYLHLTKRFGQVGASQLPIHYLLAMRAPYSPVQWLTRCSHEQLKVSHQVLGRIVFLLFILHGVFYFNFFVLSGFLAKRIKDWDVIWGIVSIILFSIISTTALAFVRRKSYRLFYVSHIAIANLIILPLWLHVSHIRIYVYQVILVEALHILFRALRLKVYQGTIRLLPGTNLIQIRIPLPEKNSALGWEPGQHVYLSRPWGKATTPSFYQQWIMTNKTNPFTIASIPGKDKELLLVARTLKGNTKYLADLARSLAQGGSGVPMLPTSGGDIPILPIALEGPYGASKRLPDLSSYDKVLLVAGGIGATFVMPVYRSIIDLHNPTPTGTQIRCIWAVQKLVETQWAFPFSASPYDDHEEDADGDQDGLLENSGTVEIYVTRPSGPSLQTSEAFAVGPDDDEGETIEMAENEQLLSMEEQMDKPRKGMVVKSGRPPLDVIVDEVFSKGMRTAVICCGPKRLTEDLKRSVEVWVKKGHEVFWYDETFGW
ncbi:ferric reductase like transmembrane component-domain-containing protein [Ampelomyces quisqualis]|uniref:Ferric reductase like transmembrane component-domain-containing protein n=1 Tax=Ampelomyces quisqualis TaxID=50730 RepID=A0A6A5QZ35_AMPQU|nr:ferric reductase like transmembrane component-domain-containing protein [Ampelomyces quisqualis]